MNVSEKPQPELKKRKLSLRQLQQPKTRLGLWGELKAQQFLKQKNYSILATNLSNKWGEVDIIAFDPVHQELVFCEVKTRKSSQFGHPSQAVNQLKLARMRKLAIIYFQAHQRKYNYRFDVISISGHSIEHQINVTM